MFSCDAHGVFAVLNDSTVACGIALKNAIKLHRLGQFLCPFDNMMYAISTCRHTPK